LDNPTAGMFKDVIPAGGIVSMEPTILVPEAP
jgi:hypothetical protein